MGKKKQTTQNTTPVQPSYVTDTQKAYFGQLQNVAAQNPQKAVTPISPLQQQAINGAARLGGGGMRPSGGSTYAAAYGANTPSVTNMTASPNGPSTGGQSAPVMGMAPATSQAAAAYGSPAPASSGSSTWDWNSGSGTGSAGSGATYRAGGSQSNKAGIAGGALSGAAMGSQILPGWGTAIGAVVGGIAGAVKGKGGPGITYPTFASTAQNNIDYSRYAQDNPDVVAYWNGNKGVQSEFSGNLNDFLAYHYKANSSNYKGAQDLGGAPTGTGSENRLMYDKAGNVWDGTADPMAAQPQSVEQPTPETQQQSPADAYMQQDTGPSFDSTAMYTDAANLARQAAATQYTPESMDTPDKVSYRTFNGDAVQQQFNPYINQVADAYKARAQETLNGQLSDAASQRSLRSAYGGSRGEVGDAELRRLSALDTNSQYAGLLSSGWDKALGNYNQDSQGLYNADTFNANNKANANQFNVSNRNQAQLSNIANMYSGATALGNIAGAGDQNTRANIATQAQMGDLQRAYDEAVRNADWTQLAKIQALMQAGVPNGQTQTGTAPGDNPWMTALGVVGTGADLWSKYGGGFGGGTKPAATTTGGTPAVGGTGAGIGNIFSSGLRAFTSAGPK